MIPDSNQIEQVHNPIPIHIRVLTEKHPIYRPTELGCYRDEIKNPHNSIAIHIPRIHVHIKNRALLDQPQSPVRR